MDARSFVLLLVFWGVCMSPAVAVCPYNVTACKCHTQLILCRDLDSIPPLLSTNADGNYSSLIIQDGKVDKLSGNILPWKLSSLALYNLPVAYISPDAFVKSSDTLYDLELNNITYNQLPSALLNIRNLTTFDMSNMAIANWNITILRYVAKTARSIYFSNVSLTQWPLWSRYFTAANSVDLSKNSIDSIPNDAFANGAHLVTIILDYNHLWDGKNLLESLEPMASTLENLSLIGNRFNSIPSGLSALSKLSKLCISSNHITEITADKIPTQLRELDICSNQIKQLSDNSFPNPSALRILRIKKNPLSSISKSAFKPLQHLQLLYLSYTNLMKIPLTLVNLKELNVLELDGISHLHCDCPRDTQLIQWYTAMKNFTVSGNCEQKSFEVQKYFRNDTYRLLCSGADQICSDLIWFILLFGSVCVMNIM